MCIISDLPLSQAPNPPIHSVLFTVVQSRVSHFLESLKVLNKLKVLLAMELLCFDQWKQQIKGPI